MGFSRNVCTSLLATALLKKKIEVHVHAMKAWKGSRCTDLLILNRDAVWRSTSRPGHGTPGKESRYPLNGRLGGPRLRFERFGEEENMLPLPGFEFTDHTIQHA